MERTSSVLLYHCHEWPARWPCTRPPPPPGRQRSSFFSPAPRYPRPPGRDPPATWVTMCRLVQTRGATRDSRAEANASGPAVVSSGAPLSQQRSCLLPPDQLRRVLALPTPSVRNNSAAPHLTGWWWGGRGRRVGGRYGWVGGTARPRDQQARLSAMGPLPTPWGRNLARKRHCHVSRRLIPTRP